MPAFRLRTRVRHSQLRLCRAVLIGLLASLLGACLGVPEGVQPVSNFDADRYLGRWYEIARLDHRFERGLLNVTAEYSRRDDGAVRVVNRGFDVDDGEWSDIEGVARFVDDDTEGHLKVSFFGPFYASYVVFELERERYDYAFVSGFNRDYLWLLARKPEVTDALKAEFIATAAELGFDTEALIWVEHPPR